MYTQIENKLNEINTNINNLLQNQTDMPFSKNMEMISKKSNFENYVRSGRFECKSLNMSDDTGGYLLEDKVLLEINKEMEFLSPMRKISKITSVSTNALDVLVDTKTPEAGWVSENDKRKETASPEMEKIRIPVSEIYAKPMANQQLLDDAKINVEKWLVNKIAEKIAAIEDAAFINGDGVNKPKGFLSYERSKDEKFGSLQCFNTGAAGDFLDEKAAADLLIKVTCSIKPKYVKNAKWIMSRSAFEVIRKIKYKSNYLWQPSFSDAAPATLLGYPVVIDDNMPQLVSGSASISVAFGDFSNGYQIVDRQNFSLMRDPFSMKPFVEFYATKRVGGGVVDFDAIKLIYFGVEG